MKGDLKHIITALGDLFLPRSCVVCGQRLTMSERFLCSDCADDLPLTYYWDLPYNPAADRLNENIQRGIEAAARCREAAARKETDATRRETDADGGAASSGGAAGDGGEWAGHYEPYSRFAALFFYNSDNGYRHICHRLKYGGDTALGRHYSRILGERIAGSPLFSDVDLVVPVPLHWTRRWSRGYNQAEVIAAAVASCLGARHCPSLIVRSRRTLTQTVLSIEEKKANVAGAFSINSRALSRLESRTGTKPSRHHSDSSDKTKEWRPRHILIVDDVMTTGATIAECHSALRKVFPASVRISAAALSCVESR